MEEGTGGRRISRERELGGIMGRVDNGHGAGR